MKIKIPKIALLSIILLTLLVGTIMFANNNSGCPQNFVKYKSDTISVCVPERLVFASEIKGFSEYFNDEEISILFQKNPEYLAIYKNGALGWQGVECYQTSKVDFLGEAANQYIDFETLSKNENTNSESKCGAITGISLFGDKWAIILSSVDGNISIEEFNIIKETFKPF